MDIGVADSMDPKTISEIGNVAKQMFDANVCPASPPMVKIIGICAPKNACASTKMVTFRFAMLSFATVMGGPCVNIQGLRYDILSVSSILSVSITGGTGLVETIITDQSDIDRGCAWLAQACPRFAAILPELGPIPLRLRADGFDRLLSAIVSQQVSVASANAIWARLEGAGMTDPAAILTANDDDLRACGLSRQKMRYARALAAADIDFDALRDITTHDIIKTLTQVSGVGVWTAEIYAMFSLGRADVFAPGDLALQEAVRILYDMPERPSERELRQFAQAWSPWRAVAARVLWAYYKHVKEREGIT